MPRILSHFLRHDIPSHSFPFQIETLAKIDEKAKMLSTSMIYKLGMDIDQFKRSVLAQNQIF